MCYGMFSLRGFVKSTLPYFKVPGTVDTTRKLESIIATCQAGHTDSCAWFTMILKNTCIEQSKIICVAV